MRIRFVVVLAMVVGCSSSPSTDATPAGASTTTAGDGGTSTGTGPGATSDAGDPNDPGPPPEGCGDLQKDGDGFFQRDSGTSAYVAYVPPTYDGSPTPVVVGLHGCGDNAYNFATWAMAPWDTRATQKHIGISVDGATGDGSCWDVADLPKVAAAVADLARCVYVHRKKVVVAGYSSGGILAYREGLQNASAYAGILISNSILDPPSLLSVAARKIPVVHRAHTDDQEFPLADVRASWTKIESAGFPLTKIEVPGTHDGESADWIWLHAQAATWF